MANYGKQRYTLFSYTAPGYNFEEVEATIKDYKTTISDMKELLLQKETVIKDLQDQNTKLQQELTEVHLQLNAVDIPEMSIEESLEIIEDFTQGVNSVRTTGESQVTSAPDVDIHPLNQPPKKKKKLRF